MDQKEKAFWTRIANKVPGHAQRLETTIACGVPDVNVCFNGIEAWLELKVAEPKVLIRTAQWAWHNRRIHAGNHRCFVLAHDLYRDAVMIQPMARVIVEPYGSLGKYVYATNTYEWTVLTFKELHESLKIILFT